MKPTAVIAARALMRLEVDGNGCWVWPGAKGKGYGQIRVLGRTYNVHRAIYEALVGPITGDMQLDHLCRNRACANPDHLEPVTARENQHRGMSFAGINSRKTTCPKGHSYSRKSRRGQRVCQTCQNAHHRRWRAAA